MELQRLMAVTVMSLWKVMAMKRKKTGFTLVELLTVLAIITMLVGLLVPSMATVRRLAKETKQRAQLNSIGLAITAFRNEHGDYPPSRGDTGPRYCGAQMLAEALLGRDLMGFHPDSQWRLDDGVYDDKTPVGLQRRRGRYLELGTANAFRASDLFTVIGGLADMFMICDAFGVREVTLPNRERVRAGTPILYYAANTASRQMSSDPAEFENNIYNPGDNHALLAQKMGEYGVQDPLGNNFYQYISDPRVGIDWPYRPDSYILISAGADGLYGTPDNITNFGN